MFFLKNLRYRTKLMVMILSLSIIPLCIVSIIGVAIANDALKSRAMNQLDSVKKIKASNVESYFSERLSDANILSENPLVIDAIKNLGSSFEKKGINSQEYKNADINYGSKLKKYADNYGYYDLFLIDKSGNVVYTVARESDFATNVVTGKYSKSGLADAFNLGKNDLSMIDFSNYEASNNEPASFVSAPIKENGTELGVLVFQLSLKHINEIMQEKSGLGNTGESYIVGKDLLMRSDSRFSKESTVLKQRIETESSNNALSGKSGTELVNDYRDVSVLSSYSPLKIKGVQWCMIVEIDESEALAAVSKLELIMIILVAASIIAICIVSFIYGNIVIKRIQKLKDSAEKLAVGDVNISIKADSNDEIGDLMASFEKVTTTLKNLVSESATLTNAAVEGKLDTRGNEEIFSGSYKDIIKGVNHTLDAIITPFQEASSVLEEMAKGNLNISVTGNYKGDHAKIKNALNFTIGTLSSYVDEISNILRTMSDGDLKVHIERDYLGDFVEIKKSINQILTTFNNVLAEINNSSECVAEGAKQLSASSQMLSQGSTEQASSIEEVSSSISHIAEQTKENVVNANKANELATLAKEKATEGNEQMSIMLQSMHEINTSSASISRIIKVIDEIAFQTNILALNAAVEAARAGQHGKGFAVVAEEVRNLAARSANAAKETTSLIESSVNKVETGTKIANDTAVALGQIVEGINSAAIIVNEIAKASGEQASGILEVNKAINEVSEVIQTNSATSEESASASEELSEQAQVLKSMVGKFNLTKNLIPPKSMNLPDHLSPELIEILEKYSNKKDKTNDPKKNKAIPKNNINLDTFEYGKY